MAKKKPEKERIDLRADPEWIARVEEYAERSGLNMSSYIRQAVTKQMERDDAERKRLAGD